MIEGNRGGESSRQPNGISKDSISYLFGTIEVDYDKKSGVFEVDASRDPEAVIVTVGPNTDLSDPEVLVAEVERRSVVYERAEDMPELQVFPEGE